MSKKRIVGVLVVKDGIVVQSIGFSRYLPVGRPEISARFLDSYDVDEIALLDIDASRDGRLIDPEMVRRVADRLFVPLAVGGGVRSVEDMRILLSAGADKIVLNRSAIETPKVVTEGARIFGAQCLIGSIDARCTLAGYRVFIDCGRTDTGLDPAAAAKRLEDANIGEILINAIDRDGMRTGYDEQLVLSVAASVKVPVIALGGAGHPAHIASILSREGVSAAGIGNMLHYTEHSIAVIKAALLQGGEMIKHGRGGAYETATFLADGRLAMRDYAELAEQVFEEAQEERL